MRIWPDRAAWLVREAICNAYVRSYHGGCCREVPARGRRRERKSEEVGSTLADKQSVLQQAQENNVQFIRLWFTDVLGTLKSFAITVEELEDALDGGMGF